MTSEGHRDSGTFLHSNIKFWVQHWADDPKVGYKAEKEAKGEFDDDKVQPDIVLRYKYRDKKRKSIVYIEIQNNLNKSWKNKKERQYKGRQFLILDENRYNLETDGETLAFWLSAAYTMLVQDLDGFTLSPMTPKKEPLRPPYNKHDDSPLLPCERCGKPKKEKNLYVTTLGKLCRKCFYRRK